MRIPLLVAVALSTAACASNPARESNPWRAAFLADGKAPPPSSSSSKVVVRASSDGVLDAKTLRERGYVRVGAATIEGPRRAEDVGDLRELGREVDASLVIFYAQGGGPPASDSTPVVAVTSGTRVEMPRGTAARQKQPTAGSPCLTGIPSNHREGPPCAAPMGDTGGSWTPVENVPITKTATFWRARED